MEILKIDICKADNPFPVGLAHIGIVENVCKTRSGCELIGELTVFLAPLLARLLDERWNKGRKFNLPNLQPIKSRGVWDTVAGLF